MGPGTQTPYVKSLRQVPPVFVEVVEAVGREMVVKKKHQGHETQMRLKSPVRRRRRRPGISVQWWWAWIVV